ncbi:DUF302 domain-containing protein [Herbidospora sp. NBRC 101105]|uniref:DUF302 domain-containing protein n=1 Tax=Herbidospora sp. NBRC 101105 TaxID=3032195 RepID=UPI00249FCB57|nr:DUF302 domain-containing protein [Herbidospora sp. NBRC 101105]GLX96076.1 hypothetical protein Hesp01_40260 [Herbidospora sp. NBRC 101105]
MTIQQDRVFDVVYEAHRLTVDTGVPFDEFRQRYEEAVPALDRVVFDRLIQESADWATVLGAADRNAPHGFVIFWSLDNSEIMGLSGDTWRSVQYLMGNHTIAQRMFHHDPAVMEYAPLRTTVYEDQAGAARFAIDQPSRQFAAFGNPAITEVGIELDRKVAALLDFLGAPVPAQLVESE